MARACLRVVAPRDQPQCRTERPELRRSQQRLAWQPREIVGDQIHRLAAQQRLEHQRLVLPRRRLVVGVGSAVAAAAGQVRFKTRRAAEGGGAGLRLLRCAAVEEDSAVTRVLRDRLARRRRRRLRQHPADDSSDLEVLAAEAHEVGREPKDSDSKGDDGERGGGERRRQALGRHIERHHLVGGP